MSICLACTFSNTGGATVCKVCNAELPPSEGGDDVEEDSQLLAPEVVSIELMESPADPPPQAAPEAPYQAPMANPTANPASSSADRRARQQAPPPANNNRANRGPRPEGELSAWTDDPDSCRTKCYCVKACMCLFLVLFLLLLPLSVVHVSVTDYALPKRRSTAVVTSTSADDVMENGQHWLGPDYTQQVVPSRLESVNINLKAFVKNSGHELPIYFRVLWRQDPAKIHSNFLKFGDHAAVATRFTTQLEVAAKGIGISFQLWDYIWNLKDVQREFTRAIQAAASSMEMGVELHGLYFTNIELPTQIVSASLRSTLLKESEIVKLIQRTESLLRAETDQLSRKVGAEAKLIATQGTAESAALILKAQANATAIAQGAEGSGLARFFKALEIEPTDSETMQRYQQYLAIMRGGTAP